MTPRVPKPAVLSSTAAYDARIDVTWAYCVDIQVATDVQRFVFCCCQDCVDLVDVGLRVVNGGRGKEK